MKLTSIEIRNFQRISHANIRPKAPVLLVAGHNEAGKSSLRDAVRLAVTGESTRVKLKKDYKAMLREGAKDGVIGVAFEGGTASVNLKNWERQAQGLDGISDVLPFLLDAHAFIDLDAKARRSLLFKITGATFSGKTVAESMVARGADREKVLEIMPMMQSGFPAACEAAKDKAKDARGAWRGVTGEVYGSNKAESWAPVVPEFDQSAMTGLMAEKDETERQLAGAKQELAELAAKEKAMSALATVGELEDFIATEADEVAKASRILDDIRRLEDSAPTEPRDEKPVACPHCGGMSTIQAGALIPFEGNATSPQQKMEWQKHQKAMADLQADLRACDDQMARIRQAKTRLEDIRLMTGVEVDPERRGYLEGIVASLTQKLGSINAGIDSQRQAAREAIEAEEKAEKAAGHHRDAVAWEAVAEMLSPSGIPAEILGKAMAPVNEALLSVAQATGWAPITIDDQMEVRIGGRPYGLGSESAQWRADATIAYAIARVSGAGFLCLDRVDVLDPDNRLIFMKWIQSAITQGAIDSAILLGTFKQPPTLPSQTFHVVWMEDGEALIAEKGEAA